jgi:hypothetical protein
MNTVQTCTNSQDLLISATRRAMGHMDMEKKKWRARLSVVLLAVMQWMPSASASEISYDYIGIELSSIDSDVDSEASSIFASKEIAKNLYLEAGYTKSRVDDSGVPGQETTYTQIGIGAYIDASENTDFFADTTFVDAEAGSLESDARAIDIGVRHSLSNSFELSAGISHLSYDDNVLFEDTLTVKNLGARWFIVEGASVGLNYETASDIDSIGLAIQIDF